MTVKVRRSTGNVFRDLGFSKEEAENLKIRTNLMIRLSKVIETRRLTQAQAASLFGVTQPRVSDLVRGKIDRALGMSSERRRHLRHRAARLLHPLVRPRRDTPFRRSVVVPV